MFIFGWLILAGAGVASALEPPTNVTATAGAYTNQIALTWGAAVGASDYQVFRNTNDLPETAVELITTTNLYYDDADVVPGVYYHYWSRPAMIQPTAYSARSDGLPWLRPAVWSPALARYLMQSLYPGSRPCRRIPGLAPYCD